MYSNQAQFATTVVTDNKIEAPKHRTIALTTRIGVSVGVVLPGGDRADLMRPVGQEDLRFQSTCAWTVPAQTAAPDRLHQPLNKYRP